MMGMQERGNAKQAWCRKCSPILPPVATSCLVPCKSSRVSALSTLASLRDMLDPSGAIGNGVGNRNRINNRGASEWGVAQLENGLELARSDPIMLLAVFFVVVVVNLMQDSILWEEVTSVETLTL